MIVALQAMQTCCTSNKSQLGNQRSIPSRSSSVLSTLVEALSWWCSSELVDAVVSMMFTGEVVNEFYQGGIEDGKLVSHWRKVE